MKNLFLYSLLLISYAFEAQEKDRILPTANKEFEKKAFADAEANYRISQSKFPKKATAAYNMGNAIYLQKQNLEAGQAYWNAIKNAETRPEKHKAFHNLGNVFMKEKNYTNAVNAYKNALINNPDDEETRYNYALAKDLLKKNPPKNNDKNKDKKKDKDKKDDKKKDDKGNNDKDKKDKGDQNKDQPKQDDKSDKKAKPKPQEGGISKQRLENLLDAVNNEEKKIQDKVNKNKEKGRPVKTEKDW